MGTPNDSVPRRGVIVAHLRGEVRILSRRSQTSGALWLLLGLSVVALGWLVALGKGLLAVGILLLGVSYLGILVRWRLGVYGLLVFLPFAGVVTIALTPWDGLPLLHPVSYKDWLFVLPAYLGFAGAVVLRRERRPPLDTLPVVLLLALGVLVIAQMANPGVPNLLTGLLGAKVWLFYLPLYPLTAAMITSRRDLVVLLRLVVAIAIVPCAVGLAEYALAQAVGYQETMDAIYGPAAYQVTQGYVHFELGSGFIARIPSTFTFVTQYWGFTLAMLVPCYALWRADPSPFGRSLGKCMLGISAVASLLSGQRAGFIFVPLLLALLYGLDRGFTGVLRGSLYVGAALLGALGISHLAARSLFEHISELFGVYAVDTAYGGLAEAILYSPLGNGTGTNTGAARYAFNRPELFTGIENYYAKAVYELGIPGLLLIWGLFAVFIWKGLKTRGRLADKALRATAAALVAFLIASALNSFKGWLIDLDPINVYFWVFAGVLAKLPYLDSSPSQPPGTPAEGAP